jgi:outer membrane protein assembly factor BamB
MEDPMRTFNYLLTLGLVAIGASLALAADWPQFRGPGGQGVSAEKGLPTTWSGSDNIVWKTDLPGAGTSSPIFVGNKIFLTCYSGYNEPGQRGGDQENLKREFVCLDRQSGKLLWAKEVPSKLPEQDRIRDDHGYASNTPVSDGKNVFAFFGKSGVFAFDLNGKQLWHADLGDGLDGWGSAASPVLFENLVIVNASVESDSIVALNKANGEEVWRARGINQAWNTPLLLPGAGGKTELVVSIPGKLQALDPKTGNVIWTCDSGNRSYMVPSVVAQDGVVYSVGGRPSSSVAVKAGGRGDVTDSHRQWVGQKGSIVSSPVVHNGHLYWAHESQGILYCAEAESGKIVYEERLDRAGQFYASPVLADGKIYYLTRNGRTFVVAARPEFELLATNDLGVRDTFNASPVVADGRLFLRSDKHLYCIDEEVGAR